MELKKLNFLPLNYIEYMKFWVGSMINNILEIGQKGEFE